MKKVGILTINDNDNYGNRLQNYAVQEVLKKYNVTPVTIVNTTMKIKKEKVSVKTFFPRCIRKINHILKKFFKVNLERKNCFEDFNKNIEFFNEIINENSIPMGLENNFDIFFTGSDQVWNPTFPRTSDIDFLTFCSSEKRNSFSASFGISELPLEYKEKYTKYLQQINKISVREDAGKKIIEELTGRKDVEVLIDPTMMLDAEDWIKVSKKPKQLKAKKYILNYFLGEVSSERKKEIEKIAKENDCEIINILDKKSPYYQTGPSEFLYLEKNAFLICTDSFHSCVFAILFNRPFVVFNREDFYMNMNSRLETLLNKFQLKNREYNNSGITNENLNHDYTDAYQLLEEERKKTMKFLKNIINT